METETARDRERDRATEKQRERSEKKRETRERAKEIEQRDYSTRLTMPSHLRFKVCTSSFGYITANKLCLGLNTTNNGPKFANLIKETGGIQVTAGNLDVLSRKIVSDACPQEKGDFL